LCLDHGAREVQEARDEAERQRFWLGRKSAFEAMGRMSQSYYVADGVIPRTKLPEVLEAVTRIAAHYDLRIANVFHAGDGNLHPLIAFDDRKPGDHEKTVAAAAEILRVCVEAGGSISGEHGIGIEKRDCMPLQYKPADLALMSKLKSAFNPSGLCNPLKIFPTSRKCGESSRVRSSGSLDPDIAAAVGPAF
jgi:glycolate oxidase